MVNAEVALCACGCQKEVALSGRFYSGHDRIVEVQIFNLLFPNQSIYEVALRLGLVNSATKEASDVSA